MPALCTPKTIANFGGFAYRGFPRRIEASLRKESDRAIPSSCIRSVSVGVAIFLAGVVAMRNRAVSPLVFAVIAILIAIPSAPLRAQGSGDDAATIVSRSLITGPVDETQLTTLKGNTHRLARPEFDLGTAPATLPMQRMLLVLKRSPDQEYALRKLLDDQQDKKSPNYHKWLTPEQFGKQYGPTDTDMQTITSWLQSHGFQVGSTKGRTVLEFSGSASQVQEAFHTTIHKYIVNGQQHWANASDPSIPTALTPAVAGVKTLHNFLRKPMVHVVQKSIRAKFVPGSRPQFTASNGLHALAPEDYGIIYNATPAALGGISGSGITIAVVARSNLFNDGGGDGSDIGEFRNVFAVPGFGAPNDVSIVLNGPDPGDLGGLDEVEATLDASWVGALASGATIDLVVSESTNTTDGVDLSELYIIENNLGSVMTESFGTCEAGVTSQDAQGIALLAEQAAAQGITYMVSTGDTGAAGCDDLSETVATGPVSVNVLASTPFTVAVGGTMFNENGQDATYWNTTNDNALGSAKSYIPEDVWNETCTTQCQSGQPPLAAGSGGVSTFFTPKPSWQFGPSGIPKDNARDLPDVSLTAAGHDLYLVCLEASCVPDAQGSIFFAGVEGTSASAPSFAGIMALIDEKMSQLPATDPNTSPRQGQANYVLYQLALAQQNAKTACNASTTPLPNSACVFNDVTVGNNSVPGETGYPNGQYSATVGYDLASGLGSVNVANLISAWTTAAFNATTTTLLINNVASGNTTPVALAHGQSANVGVTVTSASGTPSGDVSLIAATPTFTLSNETGVAEFTLSGGTTTGAMTNLLPGGTYTVTAHYAGSVITNPTPVTTFAPSDSSQPGVLVNVSAENSTTALSGPFTQDQNAQYTVPFTTAPFGTPVLVVATVAGASNVGTPTGTVSFVPATGIPNNSTPTLNSQGTASLISNPFLLNGPTVPFDAGTYTISANYPGDASFKSSNSGSVTFTIQPGFIAVSGLANVTIASPGGSGTTTIGILASSNFTTAISFTCSGLPSEAACNSTPAKGSGPNTLVTTTITVTTTGPHLTMLLPNQRPYYFAALASGLPLAGIFLIAAPRRRFSSALIGLTLLALLVTLPACGGGGSHHQTDPGTPAGTYNVSVTATAGTNTQNEGTFTLTVQ